MREMFILNGGVYDFVKKDLVHKIVAGCEKDLVDAKSVEANAQENIECEQVVGGTWDKVGSWGLLGPQQPDLKRHAITRICFWTTRPRSMRGFMSSCARNQEPLRVSSLQ